MDIKIEKKKAFKVAGIKSDVTKSSNFPKVWDRLLEKLPREKFEELGNGQIFWRRIWLYNGWRRFIYILSWFWFDGWGKSWGIRFRYTQHSWKEYAIVSLEGPIPKCIHEGWKYIISYFFPKEGYRHDESPDFEVYGDGDPNSEDYKMELWVPIVKE